MQLAIVRPFTVTPDRDHYGRKRYLVEGVFPIVRARVANEPYRASYPTKAKADALAEKYSRQVIEDAADFHETREQRLSIARAYLASRKLRPSAQQLAFSF